MFFTGTISGYARMAQLQGKAQRRMSNPNLIKGEQKLSFLITPNNSAPKSPEVAQRISFITVKMKGGQELSGGDIEFLRKNSPVLYKQAMEIIKERREYRDELSRCKTKEEAARVHFQRMSSIASSVGVGGDAVQELEAMELVQMRSAAMTNVYTGFTSSASYRNLPQEDRQTKGDEKVDDSRETERRRMEKRV